MRIEENVPLAPLTTLRIGGPARFYARAESAGDLLEALAFAHARSLPAFVLGGGSNLVVPDEGYNGLVLHAALQPAVARTRQGEDWIFDVSAGVDWDEFVRQTCEAGISGIECLAGIPGLTGGAPVQNVGAYGQEVAQTIRTVTALDLRTLETISLSHAECAFSYRRSLFNSTERGRYIVLAVRFRLSSHARPNLSYADLARLFSGQPQPTLLQVYDAVRSIRRAKGMLLVPGDPDCRSAGSFFKNPIVSADALERVAAAAGCGPECIPHWMAGSGGIKLAAAWLIEQAGFPKGFSLGPAGISTRHTLALVNRTGDARCTHLLRLRDTIVAEVARRFQVHLEQEPVILR